MSTKSISAWNYSFLSILAIRFIFYTIDLLFTISPANQLKQEHHNTRKVIYTAALIKSPIDFQRSVNYFEFLEFFSFKKFKFHLEQVDQFSLYLLHIEKSFKAGGFFEVDVNFLYSVNS